MSEIRIIPILILISAVIIVSSSSPTIFISTCNYTCNQTVEEQSICCGVHGYKYGVCKSGIITCWSSEPSAETLLIDELKSQMTLAKKKSDSDESIMESLRLMIQIHKSSADNYKRAMESIQSSFYTLRGQLDNMVNIMKQNQERMNEERRMYQEILSKKQNELFSCQSKLRVLPEF